jgi:predicted NACHT family NTPase
VDRLKPLYEREFRDVPDATLHTLVDTLAAADLSDRALFDADYEAALVRHLDGHRHLRSLASNPLLCAMLCALNLDRRKQLPPNRMALYDAVLTLLVEHRDIEREIPRG